ncbi:MAG: permease-like cell division protein FtsX [Syntrophomonadaceae bacterium]|jgi:cell division transport system permease protein
MKLKSIIYFFREAFKSMSRNRLLSIATVSTVAICILILGMAMLMIINADNFMERLESDVEIVAYLDKSLNKAEVSDIRSDIEKISGIKSVTFVSKHEALKRLEKKFGENQYNLAETLNKNPLPDAYEIKAQDPHTVAQLAGKIARIKGIAKVNYGQGVVERLFKVTNWIRIIGCILIVLLTLGAVFLIATTIRLAVFARRKEIYLMKLIGATDWFVRWPFFIEGVLLGALGGLIAILVLAFGYGSLLKNMGTALFFIPLVSNTGLLINIYIGLAAIGAFLGVIGTSISLRRFMNV